MSRSPNSEVEVRIVFPSINVATQYLRLSCPPRDRDGTAAVRMPKPPRTWSIAMALRRRMKAAKDGRVDHRLPMAFYFNDQHRDLLFTFIQRRAK